MRIGVCEAWKGSWQMGYAISVEGYRGCAGMSWVRLCVRKEERVGEGIGASFCDADTLVARIAAQPQLYFHHNNQIKGNDGCKVRYIANRSNQVPAILCFDKTAPRSQKACIVRS
jgi:hypothetical protein